jgi:MFS family permease
MMLIIDWVDLPGLAIIPFTFISGLSLGASRTPRDVMLKDAAPPGQIGKVFGFVSAGLPLGSAITPVPFGYLIDRGHPEMVLMLVAGILFVSLLCGGSAKASAREEQVVVAAE